MDTNARLLVEGSIAAGCESKHTENMWGNLYFMSLFMLMCTMFSVFIYSKTGTVYIFFTQITKPNKHLVIPILYPLQISFVGFVRQSYIHTLCWFIVRIPQQMSVKSLKFNLCIW